jgi:hypothetical protein
MERAQTFDGSYEGGRDQHLGNVYNGSVYIGVSNNHEPENLAADSGNSEKLQPGLYDDDNEQPSYEGMCSAGIVQIP